MVDTNEVSREWLEIATDEWNVAAGITTEFPAGYRYLMVMAFRELLARRDADKQRVTNFCPECAARAEAEAGAVVVEGHFPKLVGLGTVVPSDLQHFDDEPSYDSEPVTVTIRRKEVL